MSWKSHFVYQAKLELEALGIHKPSLKAFFFFKTLHSTNTSYPGRVRMWGSIFVWLIKLLFFLTSFVWRKGSLLSRSWLSSLPPETTAPNGKENIYFGRGEIRNKQLRCWRWAHLMVNAFHCTITCVKSLKKENQLQKYRHEYYKKNNTTFPVSNRTISNTSILCEGHRWSSWKQHS